MFLGKHFKQSFCFITILFCSLTLISLQNSLAQTTKALSFPEVTFNPEDRILILAPHPDDEVIGCGGIIQKAKDLNLPIRIVFFTYGDNNQWSFLLYRKRPVLIPKSVRSMGLIRHDEALAADHELGITPKNLIFLGYPDFRTLNIWYSHWGSRPPARSMLTEVKAVPYANAFRPGTPYKGDEILKDLKTILGEFKPTKIFVSHPGDHNSDHRSLYLFTRVALWDLEKEINPIIYPYLVHFKKWPEPLGYHPDKQLIPPGLFYKKIPWQIYKLNPQEIERKEVALKKHRSQFKSSAKYLISFIRSNELFGDFPEVSLKEKTSSTMLSLEDKEDFMEFPEGLTDEERASFVGIQERSVNLEDGNLVVSVKLSRPVGETVGISVFIFGYRRDHSFSTMPKLSIRFGAVKHMVFDQNQRLPLNVIKVNRKPRKITIRIPLEVLGNPQYILTSARTYLGKVPLDWVSWRILKL